MQSSLWSRTLPGSVRLADCNACARFMGVLARCRAPVVSSGFRFFVDAIPETAKTRFYSNLKRFIKKESRFTPDVHDSSGAFPPSLAAKHLFRRAFPPRLQSLYDWACPGPAPGVAPSAAILPT